MTAGAISWASLRQAVDGIARDADLSETEARRLVRDFDTWARAWRKVGVSPASVILEAERPPGGRLHFRAFVLEEEAAPVAPLSTTRH